MPARLMWMMMIRRRRMNKNHADWLPWEIPLKYDSCSSHYNGDIMHTLSLDWSQFNLETLQFFPPTHWYWLKYTSPIHPTMEMYTCTIWTGTFGTVDYVGNICTIFCSWLLASLPLYLAIGTCGGIFNYWDFLHHFQLIATADIFGTFFNCYVATTGNILGKFSAIFWDNWLQYFDKLAAIFWEKNWLQYFLQNWLHYFDKLAAIF